MTQLSTEQRLAYAIEALRYYGATDTWTRSGRGETYKAAPFTQDHGERARAALRVLDAPAPSLSLWSRWRAAFGARHQRSPRPAVTVPGPTNPEPSAPFSTHGASAVPLE